jgi:hypothetical protein
MHSEVSVAYGDAVPPDGGVVESEGMHSEVSVAYGDVVPPDGGVVE